MKFFLLALLSLFSIISSGQPFGSIVDLQKLWSNLNIESGPPPYSITTNFIRFSNDTLIENVGYRKVMRSDEESQQNFSVIGFIREDSTSKVFYRTLTSNNDWLLYDFNLEVNDSIRVNFGIDLKVSHIDTVILNGKYLKRMTMKTYDGIEGEQWIEGIGSLCGVLNSGLYGIVGGTLYLLCYYENDSLIYSNPDFDDCYYNNTSVGLIAGSNVKVNIFQNPITSTSTLTLKESNRASYVFQIFKING